MLKKEEGREGEGKVDGAASRRHRTMAAVAQEWWRWQAVEVEVRRAAAGVLRGSKAWRATEERREDAEDAAMLARERVREARALAERACLDGHPRRDARRLRFDVSSELRRRCTVL
eukprot:COSAG05_NODE_833_length_7066_cov_45.021961_9_plen_116_part_00